MSAFPDRYPLRIPRYYNGYNTGPRGLDPKHCDWATVVGDRIRRMRLARGWRLVDLSDAVRRPDGNYWSAGFYSKLERGWASAPLYAYLAIAAVFDVDAGRLLGADSAMLDASEAELTLIMTLRKLEIAPHEALAELVQARSTAIRSSSPSMCVDAPPLAPSNDSDVASVSPDT